MTNPHVDVEASFWTIPKPEWPNHWVHILLGTPPADPAEACAAGELIRLDRVQAHVAEAAEAHRGTVLLPDRLYRRVQPKRATVGRGYLNLDPRGLGWGRVTPLLLDIDIADGAHDELDQLRQSTEDEVRRRGWTWRCYRSGTGYHVEVDPGTIPEVGVEWWLRQWPVDEVLDNIRDAVDGRVSPFAPHRPGIDRWHTHLRMVGSSNPKSGAGSKMECPRPG